MARSVLIKEEDVPALCEEIWKFYEERPESWSLMEFVAYKKFNKDILGDLAGRNEMFAETLKEIKSLLEFRIHKKLASCSSFDNAKWIFILKSVYGYREQDNTHKLELSGAIVHSVAAHTAFRNRIKRDQEKGAVPQGVTALLEKRVVEDITKVDGSPLQEITT